MSGVVHMSEMVSIALHSMVLIAAQKDGNLNAKKISQKIGASEFHVSKVMQRLVKTNFIRSVRGPKGGFYLAKPPEQIKLLDIYTAIEGPIPNEQKCPANCKVCAFKKCLFGGVPQQLNQQFKQYLASKKLSELINYLK